MIGWHIRKKVADSEQIPVLLQVEGRCRVDQVFPDKTVLEGKRERGRQNIRTLEYSGDRHPIFTLKKIVKTDLKGRKMRKTFSITVFLTPGKKPHNWGGPDGHSSISWTKQQKLSDRAPIPSLEEFETGIFCGARRKSRGKETDRS